MNFGNGLRRIYLGSQLIGLSFEGLASRGSGSSSNLISRSSRGVRFSSSKGFEDLDKPIKFTTSKAADWSAQQSFSGTIKPDVPWIQPYAVILSTAAVLIYFCVLREENDLDEQMGTPIWQRVPGLELQQLKVLRDYNNEHHLDNAAVLARIAELELAEKSSPR